MVACNIATLIADQAVKHGDQTAIISLLKNQKKRLLFSEFHQVSDEYALSFEEKGITRGMSVIVLIPHSIDFYLVMFALFKMGAIPVVIDPGMSRNDLLTCIETADADAVIGIPLVFFLKRIFRKAFAKCCVEITVSQNFFWRFFSLAKIQKKHQGRKYPMLDTQATDLAAILFTSGSTGVAKGVLYEHGMFYFQAMSIKEMFQLKSGQTDLPCFPLFGLFSLALGVTLYVPDINPSYPAQVDPSKVVDAIRKYQISNCFASPAIWGNVMEYCRVQNIKLPSLVNAMAAGAPIEDRLIAGLVQWVLPENGDLWIPYGATESLPVSYLRGRERLLKRNTAQDTLLKALCVGRVVAKVHVQIVQDRPDAISNLQEKGVVLPKGSIGEIVVQSPSTTKEYFKNAEKTKLAKIHDASGLWHRMGDVGFLDHEGYLWYCGRKDHVVRLSKGVALYSVPCEMAFNEHVAVNRSALVGIKKNESGVEAVIVVELKSGYENSVMQTLATEILQFGCEGLGHRYIMKLLFHSKLPVDVRHNAKINREWLAEWASHETSFYEISL